MCACARPAAGDEGPEPVGVEVNAELDDEEDCEDGVELRAVCDRIRQGYPDARGLFSGSVCHVGGRSAV